LKLLKREMLSLSTWARILLALGASSTANQRKGILQMYSNMPNEQVHRGLIRMLIELKNLVDDGNPEHDSASPTSPSIYTEKACWLI
jgi:hypothetical protein